MKTHEEIQFLSRAGERVPYFVTTTWYVWRKAEDALDKLEDEIYAHLRREES